MAFALMTVALAATSHPVRAAPPLSASISFNPSTVRVWTNVSGNLSFQNGAPPYTLWANGTAPGTGCSPPSNPFQVPGDQNFTCQPSQVGTYHYHLDVIDANGNTASASTTLVVLANSTGGGNGPLRVTISFNRSSVVVGANVTGTISIQGGIGPYTVYVTGAIPGCSPPSNPFQEQNSTDTFTCQPSQAGTYAVHIDVTDPHGNTGSADVTLIVSAAGGGGGGGGFAGGLFSGQNLILIVGGPLAVVAGLLGYVVWRRKHSRATQKGRESPHADAEPQPKRDGVLGGGPSEDSEEILLPPR